LIPETNKLERASEKDVIHGVKQGDPDCFELLYRDHKRYVYALCLRITQNPADAEDLTQDVFLQVFRKVATFRGDSSFLTWLHRVAFNVALQHLRKKRLPTVPEPLETQSGDSTEWEIATTDSSLAFLVDRILLEQSVNELPRGYRQAFRLHDIEGYEHKEIANLLQCSVGNSKSQLHKARLKLRSRLEAANRQTISQRAPYSNLVAA
jgi:RNA polymerase sigma-70 factor, ECF subfamily